MRLATERTYECILPRGPPHVKGFSARVFDMADIVALIEQAEAPQPASLSESHSD